MDGWDGGKLTYWFPSPRPLAEDTALMPVSKVLQGAAAGEKVANPPVAGDRGKFGTVPDGTRPETAWQPPSGYLSKACSTSPFFSSDLFKIIEASAKELLQ